MATFCLPLINPGDYESFRSVLNNDLPDTYDEWGNLHLKQLSNIRSEGEVCREIKVYPDEFARFCAARKASPCYQLLRDFAAKKSGGNPY